MPFSFLKGHFGITWMYFGCSDREEKEEDLEKKIHHRKHQKNVFNKQLRYIKQSNTFQQSQSSESDAEQVVFDTTTYICDECGASYENKLMGLTHKLTHYKQPKIELVKSEG